jgi:hypothetical protein
MAKASNVILVHGARADGSSWSKIIPLRVDQNVRRRPPREHSGTPSVLPVRTNESKVLGR